MWAASDPVSQLTVVVCPPGQFCVLEEPKEFTEAVPSQDIGAAQLLRSAFGLIQIALFVKCQKSENNISDLAL